MSDIHASNQAIETAASEWVVRRASPLSATEESEFQQWTQLDPRHAAAFDRLARAWNVFDRVGQQGAMSQVTARVMQRTRRRRRRWQAAAIVGAIMLGGFLYTTQRTTLSNGSSNEAITSLVRKLPDGSIVELNRGAEIDVRYDATSRRVVLLKGEAHFRVEKDPLHTFRVQAGNVEVVAVGTAFTVELAPQDVEVVVTEGRVSVDERRQETPAAQSAPITAPTMVEAGNRMLIPTEKARELVAVVKPMTDAEMDQRLSWRASRLEFEGVELEQAVILLNRANRAQISFAEPAIGKLRVSGTFRADNPDGFVRIVESTFDLQGERRSADEIILRRP
jgi:transmembrane sensor